MIEENSINQRVKILIEQLADGKQNVFVRETGIPASTISSITGERQTSPSYEVIFKIAKRYDNVNLGWLIKGEGDKFKTDVPVLKKSQIVFDSTKANIFYIENETATAGILGGYGDSSLRKQDLPKVFIPGFENHTAETFMLPVRGQSMYPMISSGDMVIATKVNSIEDVREGLPYVVCSQADGAVVKRLEKKNKEVFVLHSDNPKHKPYELHISKIESIHLVLGVVSFDTSQRNLFPNS